MGYLFKPPSNIAYNSLYEYIFHFPWINALSVSLTLSETAKLFSNWLYYFPFLPAMYQSSSSSFISSPIPTLVSVFNFSHSGGCTVVSHYCFNWHFSYWRTIFSTFWHAYLPSAPLLGKMPSLYESLNLQTWRWVWFTYCSALWIEKGYVLKIVNMHLTKVNILKEVRNTRLLQCITLFRLPAYTKMKNP